jgi:hypothetical protein
VHFEVPADDGQRLLPAEQRTYDEMRSRPMRPAFRDTVASHLRELLPTTLPSGVRAGQCGLRYEHLRAVCDGAGGMEALVELELRIAAREWSEGMLAARLMAVLKGADETHGYRPVASGEQVTYHGKGTQPCYAASAGIINYKL